MDKSRTLRRLGVIVAVIAAGVVAPVARAAPEAEVTTLMSKDLADFPGKEGTMIVVTYPPGSVDPVHRHNAHAFI